MWWVTVLVCAAIGAASGLLVPRIIASVPEPEQPTPEQRETEGPAAEIGGRAHKIPYDVLSARPGLARRAVAYGAVGGFAVGWAVETTDTYGGLPALLFLVPVGVALGVIDWHTRLLPTKLIAPSYGVVLPLLCLGALATGVLLGDLSVTTELLVRTALGWLVFGGLFFLLWLVYPRGMGYGDVRLAGLLGLALGYVGWPHLLLALEAGFLLGALGGGMLSLLRKVDRKAYPFGPFMLIGAVVGLVFGPAALLLLVTA